MMTTSFGFIHPVKWIKSENQGKSNRQLLAHLNKGRISFEYVSQPAANVWSWVKTVVDACKFYSYVWYNNNLEAYFLPD